MGLQMLCILPPASCRFLIFLKPPESHGFRRESVRNISMISFHPGDSGKAFTYVSPMAPVGPGGRPQSAMGQTCVYSGATLLDSCCLQKLITDLLSIKKDQVQVDRQSSGQHAGNLWPPDDDWNIAILFVAAGGTRTSVLLDVLRPHADHSTTASPPPRRS